MAASNVCGITIEKFTHDIVAAGSTETLVATTNNNDIVLLDTAGSTTITLPAATGSGVKFKFIVDTAATSPNHSVKVANANDILQGTVVMVSELAAPVNGFSTNATSDTIKLNSTTLGGLAGDWLEVIDYKANTWHISGVLGAVGTPVTPFSATVS
jgi:hypothetical protein